MSTLLRLDFGPAFRLDGGDVYWQGIWAPRSAITTACFICSATSTLRIAADLTTGDCSASPEGVGSLQNGVTLGESAYPARVSIPEDGARLRLEFFVHGNLRTPSVRVTNLPTNAVKEETD